MNECKDPFETGKPLLLFLFEGLTYLRYVAQAVLRVYFDAVVLFASAASPSDHSARQVLLTLSEITLIEGPHADRADWKDLPHRVAALEHNCAYLTTYNVDDYEPGHPEVEILRPGALVRQVREQLSSLWLQRPVVLSLSPVRR